MSALSWSPNRRNFLAFSAAASAAGVLSSRLQAGTDDGTIRPFRVDVPEEETPRSPPTDRCDKMA